MTGAAAWCARYQIACRYGSIETRWRSPRNPSPDREEFIAMPELPEVETTRRQIAPILVGRRIERVETTANSYFFLTPPKSCVDPSRERRSSASIGLGNTSLRVWNVALVFCCIWE